MKKNNKNIKKKINIPKKKDKIFFYQIGGENSVCDNNKSHNMNFENYLFETNDHKIISRFVRRCSNCNKYFIDTDKYFSVKHLCSKVEKYLFVPNDYHEKKEKKDFAKKVKKNPYVIYVKESNLENHIACIKPDITKKIMKSGDNQCVLHGCKTCGRYFCFPNELEQYNNFKEFIKLKDYNDFKNKFIEKTKQMEKKRKAKKESKEKAKKRNFTYTSDINKMTANKELELNTKKRTSKTGITEEDYYRILNRIKNQNKYDFLIKGTTQFCSNRKHKIISIEADLDIIGRDGKIGKIKCPAYYCENCNVFYIYNTIFENIKNSGTLLCKIYDMFKINTDNNYYELNSESIMHSYGYNVNANDDLTMFQRQTILKNLLDNRIMSRNEITNHLTYLYNRSRNLKNFSQARKRWNDDIDFVSNYRLNTNISVGVSSLTRIKYIKK